MPSASTASPAPSTKMASSLCDRTMPGWDRFAVASVLEARLDTTALLKRDHRISLTTVSGLRDKNAANGSCRTAGAAEFTTAPPSALRTSAISVGCALALARLQPFGRADDQHDAADRRNPC